MNKKEAIEKVIGYFHNDLIARNWRMDEEERDICKALKIKIPKGQWAENSMKKSELRKLIKEIIQESLDREIVVITNTGKQVFSERKVKEELMNKNYTSDNLYGWLYRDILSRGYLYTKETNKLNAKKLSINVIKQAIDDILQKVIDYNSSVVINVSKEKGKKPIIWK